MRKKWSKLPATKIGEVIDAIGRGGGGFSRSKPIKNVVKKSAKKSLKNQKVKKVKKDLDQHAWAGGKTTLSAEQWKADPSKYSHVVIPNQMRMGSKGMKKPPKGHKVIRDSSHPDHWASSVRKAPKSKGKKIVTGKRLYAAGAAAAAAGYAYEKYVGRNPQ